jgi:hypothetical protein
MANTLHANDSGRKQATCSFGAAQVRFSFHESETLGRLSARAVDSLRGFQEMSQCRWATTTKASSTLRGRVQRDRRVVTSMSRLLAERYLTELAEPCGALPRKCLFILLRINAEKTGQTRHSTRRFKM